MMVLVVALVVMALVVVWEVVVVAAMKGTFRFTTRETSELDNEPRDAIHLCL